ncbi:uncharacterized protein LOC135345811 isoform X2 [Halichondria panicea]|uniref:uncharacterized protein LOC135345811 isoform X2 n=1 Tax=Halichondria panicea TaxID=6063 RepID=UPI00312BA8F1
MVKCYTLLLLSALLVSSMSAPAPNTDTGGEENDQDQRIINPRLNPISKWNSIQLLIEKFSNFLEDLPLDQLTLLESAKDISEFQGILGALIHDDNKGGENVFGMIDQLKDRYTMLHGIVRGLIAKTGKSNPVSGNEPSSQNERLHPVSRTEEPSKEPPSQSNGQSPSKLDGAVEKIVEQQLMAAMKTLPVEDLEKLQSMLAEKSDPSQILKEIQPTFPKLTDDLIKITVKYPSELKAVIEQVLLENKLKSVTPAATTAQPSEPTSQVTDDSKQEDKKVKAEDKKIDMKISDETKGEDISTKEDGKMDIFDDDKEKDVELIPGEVVDEHDYQDTKAKPWNPYWERQTTNWMQDFQRRPVKTGGWFGAWHFLIIFLLIAALVGVGYICSHNKTKIRAYIAEVASKGRKARNYTYKQVSTT